MPLKNKFKELKQTFDRVLDAIDPPHQNQPPPPVPHGSRPGYQPGYQQYPPPPIPYSSHPYGLDGAQPSGPSGRQGPDAPPTYTPNDPSKHPYWAPIFAPLKPVSTDFDYDVGATGWGNNELQLYTRNTENAFYSPHGTLVIRAISNSFAAGEQRYTSARLVSKQRLSRKSGYVTIGLSAPSAEGIWPAVWLLPEEPFSWPADGEVDIFEAWNGIETNHSCLHWGNYTSPFDKSKHRVTTTPINAITHRHEYGFAWDQPNYGTEGGRMLFFVDGKAVMKCEKPAGTRRFEGWRLLLNIAMGGNVCDGKTPGNGVYQMEIHSLLMWDEIPGPRTFEDHWGGCSEGKTLE